MENQENNFFRSLGDILINLAFIVILAVFIRSYIVSPFRVNGPSMCNTLNVFDGVCQKPGSLSEEKIIVNEIVYQRVGEYSFGKPSAGDIIIFRPPTNTEEREYYVKRIIGEPGDTIKIVDGKVYKLFNEEFIELDESSYLSSDNNGNTYVANIEKSEEVIYQVPDGYYFVLGDNRAASADSRSCFSNFTQKCSPTELSSYVPRENIRGRAEVVFWPLKNVRILESAEYGI